MALVFKTPKSAINTYTKDIQNLGSGECPPCPECPEINLETADVEYTENGEYTLTPEGDGFSKVDITVNIDTEAIADAAYAEGEAAGQRQGYQAGYEAGETSGIETGIAEQKAKLTSTTITENGITTREDGWNSVTVNVDVTTPYNNGVAAGEAAQKAKLTSGTFVSNGTYTREDGYNSVTVNVPSDINNQDKTVDPSTSQQTVSADNGYSGLGQVTVNAVTSSIDRSIQPENIVKGVSILGVNGSYDPQPNLETGEFEIETVGTSTFTPDRADGFDSVEIRVLSQPMGSANNPFGNIETILDTDFEDGYYNDDIASGEINETTGYYDAVANSGSVFHIKPYSVNPDFDPENPDPEVPEYIFPEDFDLADRSITVWFNKSDFNPIYDRETLVGGEFNDCELVAINFNFEPETWPFGTLRVTENGTVDPSGYAEIDVNVQPTLQTKSVIPSDRQQVITPDRDYDGLSEVTVSGVTAAIDQNITASNIKDGVTILGVTGTYDPQPSLESKTASYTANGTYTITPSTGYDGMSDVEVTVNVSGGSGTQCPDWSSIGWDCNDVAASGIDADVAYTAQKKAEYEAGTITTFANDGKLKFAPKIAYRTGGSLFSTSGVVYIPDINFSAYTGDGSFMGFAQYCASLSSCGIIDFANKATSLNNMFSNCSNLVRIAGIIGTANVTNFSSAFSNCKWLIAIPSLDTSAATEVSIMFAGASRLETIPQLDFNSVTTVYRSFGNTSTTYLSNLTTLGGFRNLGKAFVGVNTNNHLLDLSGSSQLTKESLMNVINNLAAPDDTTVTDATLKLSATSYALLTAEDIAIATAKNWSVTSA